jgi:hypothetical protein
VLALTLLGFGLAAAGLGYLASLRRARLAPVRASGVEVTGRRAQYAALGYANMGRRGVAGRPPWGLSWI